MCGIVGYIGEKEACDVLIDGLKRLEYRGYDSAGIAVLNGREIEIERAEGKLSELEARLRRSKPSGTIGVGHTRWATHGIPSMRNAHPHRVGDVVVVHNGIIENHAELRRELQQAGSLFQSETDTEVFGHLIHRELQTNGDMHSAMLSALKKVRGSYALVVLYAKDPGRLYCARLASPLVLGLGKKENLVASDVPALLPYTRSVLFLEEGESAVIAADTVTVFDSERRKVDRTAVHIDWDPVQAEKGGYKHFMLKEIFEQPRVVEDTLRGRMQIDSGTLVLEGLEKINFKKIEIIACGTSWHAGKVGKYWIEQFSRIPTSVTLASEFRYSDPLVDAETLVIPISQSGETADTLAAVKLAKQKGSKILAVCNVLGSSITREADVTLYTYAGPEIGVASTKAFVAQLTVLYLITLELAGRFGKMGKEERIDKMTELRRIPQLMEQILKNSGVIREVADRYAEASHFLFIARGPNYPLALEGALKLKEISYLHAEGFASGELKHGPIAMIDRGVPVISLVPRSQTFEKVLSNIEEVRSRGGEIIAIAEEGDEMIEEIADHFIPIPKSKYSLTPLLYAIPLQLFAYYIADRRGTDVDQPRNLAKSVTVE